MNEERIFAEIEQALVRNDPALAARMDMLNAQLLRLRRRGERALFTAVLLAVLTMAGLLALGVTHGVPAESDQEQSQPSTLSSVPAPEPSAD